MDHKEDSASDEKGSEALSDSDDDHRSIDGRPKSSTQCFYCKNVLDDLIHFQYFYSCRPCMQLEMLKADQEREAHKLSTSSGNASAADEDDGNASQYSSESDDDHENVLQEGDNDAGEVAEAAFADSPRDSLDSGSLSLSTQSASSPQQLALQLLIGQLAKRPLSFDADSVFQEPITYKKFEPFDNIQPFDAKRWMFYRNPLVGFTMSYSNL